MKSIQDDLAYAMQAAEFTGDKPDDRLVKAFRAKEFGRCPKCDNPALIIHRGFNKQIVECRDCRTSITIENYEIFYIWQASGFYIDDAFSLLVVDKMTQ